IEGNAFTWNMVRCIVTALKRVGKEKDVEWFRKMLHPEFHRERIQPSPPYGLLLKDVKYEGIIFEIDPRAIELLHLRLKKRLVESGILYKLLSLELESSQSGK
ncbi:MAG: tRNA pseudouridine(38-40) synthase TruA, partial [Archaeoglobaceae archaeon]|nr:tRNA pseudouridine(38-40) synthase TruA [Archaeoglobaceae archaeon]